MGMALQNLTILIASLILLVFVKTDITLYLSWAVMGMVTVRSLLSGLSAGAISALILMQSIIFGLGMWYVFAPQRFIELMFVLGFVKNL